MNETHAEIGAGWAPVVRLAAVAAIVVTVMIPFQAAVFVLAPPPSTPLAYFDLFAQNPVLGLLDLDLLLTVDYLLMIPLYIALFASVERAARGWGLLALILGVLSLSLFFVSREATFSMWQLSSQFAATTGSVARAALVASGQDLLTLYNGGTFGLSYLLGAASTLVFSIVMLRHRVFGVLPGAVGIATGITMLVPPNLGAAGVVLAMLSLILTAWWLILLSRSFLRITKGGSTRSAHAERVPSGGRGEAPPGAL